MGSKQKYSILQLGLRGLPNVQGGVEAHVEHLAPKLVELGAKVEVIVRTPYQPKNVLPDWNNVHLRPLWAPKSKGLEAIVHSFIGVLYAALLRPDILHIQAIGPALWAPLARLFGLKVVVTNHGPDYDRQKWGRFAKIVLRFGERMGMAFANERIVISDVIRNIVSEKYGQNSVKIPNGVILPNMNANESWIKEIGLIKYKYVILVSRLVKEKRHLDLIYAFSKAKLDGWKLVIVGDSDHLDAYTKKVFSVAIEMDNVIMAGFQSGDILKSLYQYAGIFALPSSHEGLPIVVLEALSYGLPVVASDIPANREVGLDLKHYFALGDIKELSERLCFWASQGITEVNREERRKWVAERYDWGDIAKSTMEVYHAALNG